MEPGDHAQIEEQVTSLRRAMWADGGLLRSESSLRNALQAQSECDAGVEQVRRRGRASRQLFEAHSLSRVARAILCSALGREESRGAHFRNDFPHRDDAKFQKHSIYRLDGRVDFEAW